MDKTTLEDITEKAFRFYVMEPSDAAKKLLKIPIEEAESLLREIFSVKGYIKDLLEELSQITDRSEKARALIVFIEKQKGV